ncbi:MAG: polysaccharide biosynthesis/export family protein [Pseudomonadota bacterium]
MNRIGILLFAMTVTMLGGLTACQQAPISSSTIETAEPTSVRPAAEYELGNGDSLRVTVFGEAELSGEYQVDGVGNISMPLIGTFEVVGLTVQGFQARAESLYRDGDFLKDPRVSAEVTTFRPYYILGEVNNPGEYDFSSGLTVLKAVATAQGFTYRANRRVVFIRGNDATVESRVELTDTTPVQPGDTIRIVERLF